MRKILYGAIALVAAFSAAPASAADLSRNSSPYMTAPTNYGPYRWTGPYVGAYVGVWYASPQFALTPDGRSLITASEDGELARWDLRTRKKTRTWKIETGLAPALAVSPDGLTVAVGMKSGVQLIDLRSGTARTATDPKSSTQSFNGRRYGRSRVPSPVFEKW